MLCNRSPRLCSFFPRSFFSLCIFQPWIPFTDLFSVFSPKTSFSFYCSVALLVTKFLSFLCLKMPLFCFYYWRIFLVNREFCFDSFFPFSTLKILFYLAFMVAEGNSAIKLYYVYNMYVICMWYVCDMYFFLLILSRYTVYLWLLSVWVSCGLRLA